MCDTGSDVIRLPLRPDMKGSFFIQRKFYEENSFGVHLFFNF